MTKINTWKWGVILAIAIAIFLFGRKCGSDGSVVVKDRENVRIDTIPGKIEVVIDTQYVPKPYKVVERLIFENRNDTVYIDTSQFIKDCEAIVYYSDTVKIDFGHTIINDTVTENRIAGRGVKTNQRLPVIKETVTIFQPQRNIVYIGFSGTGSKQNFFYSIGTDLSLKTRNDRIYSAGVNLTRDNQVLFEGGVKFPIRLKQRVYSK